MPIPDHLSGQAVIERGASLLRELSYFRGDVSGWTYYLLCGLFFISCGLVTGYFIWRKGYMQTLDSESEVRATGIELQKLREDLKMEELELGLDRDGSSAGDGRHELPTPVGDEHEG